jgi:hypothetical protein
MKRADRFVAVEFDVVGGVGAAEDVAVLGEGVGLEVVVAAG